MRRFVSLAVLLFFTIPFGLSVIGCGHKAAPVQYCNGTDSGPVVGQLDTLTLSPSLAVTGESLNYGQIGSYLSASGLDCKGSTVSAAKIVYATTDMSFADINPSTGQVCGGTWNRNSGAGIADYTFCTAPTATALKNTNGATKTEAFVTATADGIVSNAIAVYIHPVVTSIIFGQSTSACAKNASGALIDPDNTCCPADPTTVVTAKIYDGLSCVSQNDTRQISARIYANGTTNPADNITCSAGHLIFGTEGSANILTLDQNGVATAVQPGSVSLNASLSTSSSASTVGFFSTCAPASITLTPVNQTSSTNISVPLNNSQTFNTTVVDTAGRSITGLSLIYESTQPQTLPAGSGSATPIFPGTATLTALCEPPTCNPAPFSQVGYLGNGKPVTSNGVTVTTAGSSSTEIVIASTQSQYAFPVDFSTGLAGSLVKLPYVPNSMVISEDGSTVYFGSPQGLMTLSTGSNTVSGPNVDVQGTVLSISPDGSTLIVADPTRDTTSLVGNGAIETSYGAIGTRAQWTPDSSTVYITTTGNTLLTHSTFTNWQSTAIQNATSPSTDTTYNDVAVMVPAIGAYFAGSLTTDGRSYCALTTQPSFTTPPPTETNFFNPIADREAVQTDRIIATADGKHILGASAATGVSDLYFSASQTNTNQPNGPASCTNTVAGTPPTPPTAPTAFFSTPHTSPFTGITATAINSIASNSASSLAFVTLTGATAGKIPYYLPSAGSAAGTLNYFTFADTTAVTAPVAGVWATDDRTFYVGTAGDNLVHELAITYTNGVPSITDSAQITPSLPASSGTGTATPNLIAQRPRRVTSGT